MGYSLSWVAVPHEAQEALLAGLGLSPAGEFEEVPESATTGVRLPTGWYAVVANHRDLNGDPAALAAVSKAADVVACGVEEHVMVSWAEGWCGGRQRWSVSHNAQAGRRNLEESGAPPGAYPEIRNGLLAKQADDPDGADYVFDIPVALAEALTGFRHDQTPAEALRFEVLRSRTGRRWRWPWNRT